MYSFKKSLEKKMLEKGLSMQGLSVRAGMEKGAVKNIMRDRSIHPRIDTVEKLATALGCRPLELLPPTWREPFYVNSIILGKAIKTVLELTGEAKFAEDKEENFSIQCQIIGMEYKKLLKETDVPGEVMKLNKD